MARDVCARGGVVMMKLRCHLSHHLGLAAINVAFIAVAMMDRYLGIGMMIGLIVSAVVSAKRDHQRQQKRAAEAAELDRQLVAALVTIREAADKEALRWLRGGRGISEKHWS